jgi:hypothetical protein
MKRFFRKSIIWLICIAAVLAVGLALFYAEEDWRGMQDWTKCQRSLAAQGETLDLRQLIPPGKPEDDLSKVPIFAELYQANPDYPHDHQFEWYAYHWPHPRHKSRMNDLDVSLNASVYATRPDLIFSTKEKSFDLASWQKYYRSQPESQLTQPIGTPAQDVLKVLSRFDSDLTKIDGAVSNPSAYWPIQYDTPFISNLDGNVSMHRVAMILTLRGIAHLENDEVEQAEKDFFATSRLNRPLTKGCLLINYTVISTNQFRNNLLLSEGLRHHSWDDSQLREIETSLASTDMLALAVDTLRIERACTLGAISLVQRGECAQLRNAAGVGDFDKYGYYDSLRMLNYRPSGEWDEEKAYYASSMQKRIGSIHLAEGILDPSAFDLNKDNELSTGWNRLYRYVSWVQLPVIDAFGLDVARTETYRRLARLACRLEQYHIAHGRYPDSLTDLPNLPPYLNQEVLSNQPLHYQLKNNRYLLSSIGWDYKDGGGQSDPDARKGDWPWPSP